MQDKTRIEQLYERWLSVEITAEEAAEIAKLLKNPDNENILLSIMERPWKQPAGDVDFSQLDRLRVAEAILRRYPHANENVRLVHRVHFLHRGWFKYAAAIIILFGVGGYFWTTNKKTDQTLASGNKQLQTDVPPGGEKAVLTLADGTKIILDSAANGNLAQQGNAQITKLANGEIAYNLKGLAAGDLMMNIMSTPKGGQYQLILPDGSRVWLNAASSIQFPAAFTGATRSVKITGEVYFEVAKNKQKPFIVDIDGKSLVEVLGTSFNVNSYENESSVKTTLIEGSVKILKGDKEAILKPGYQAVVADQQPDRKSSMIRVQSANVDQILAWKDGIFNFKGLDLRSVMRQLERWYDIKVQYKGTVSDDLTFGGKMYRNVTLSRVLKMLKDMGVKFELEGKTLVVL